jgi:hypothetical protein
MRWQSGLSHPDRMLKGVSRSRRRLARGTKPRRDDQFKGPAAPPGTAEQVARLPTAKVLERISQVRLQRDELDAELALLIGHAVSLGIGWPDIAQRLGVSRQAARQHYQRRHRQDRVA